MSWIRLVDEAIQNCTNEIKDGGLVILTESDFKVFLSTEIKRTLGIAYPNVTINTESPWYDEETPQKPYFIDITVFDRNLLNISYNRELNRKGYRYDDEAIVIELKYFRYEDDVKEIEKDFQKILLLLKSPKNFCYIIALARNEQILLKAKNDMKIWFIKYELGSEDRVRVYLLGGSQCIEINAETAV